MTDGVVAGFALGALFGLLVFVALVIREGFLMRKFKRELWR